MLTIHHLRLSQSERIVWLAEELGLDYECKLYTRRTDNRLAPDEYKALHPMGIAPVITDGDLVLGESGAIMDYIIAKYAPDTALVPGVDHPALGAHEFDAADVASVKQALHEFKFGFGQADLLCQCCGVFAQGGLVLDIECVLG